MKKKLLAISILFVMTLLAGSMAFGQDSSTQAKPETQVKAKSDEGMPRLVFTTRTHDFGDVKPNQINSYMFTFKNEGTGTLQIQNVRSSCGCTAVVPEKKVLLPGESSILQVKYHSGRYPGKVEKKISVTSNDPVESVVILSIAAQIVTDLEYTPSNLRFDNVVLDKPSTQFFYLKPNHPDTFKIESIAIDSPLLTYKTVTLPDGRTQIQVIYSPQSELPNPKGYVSTSMRIVTNSDSFPEIRVPVYLKFQPHFSVLPQRLLLYSIKGSKGVERDVLIKNNQGKRFTIDSVHSSNNFIRPEITQNGEAANVVKVKVMPGAPAGSCNGIITIRTPEGTLTVMVRGKV